MNRMEIRTRVTAISKNYELLTNLYKQIHEDHKLDVFSGYPDICSKRGWEYFSHEIHRSVPWDKYLPKYAALLGEEGCLIVEIDDVDGNSNYHIFHVTTPKGKCVTLGSEYEKAEIDDLDQALSKHYPDTGSDMSYSYWGIR